MHSPLRSRFPGEHTRNIHQIFCRIHISLFIFEQLMSLYWPIVKSRPFRTTNWTRFPFPIEVLFLKQLQTQQNMFVKVILAIMTNSYSAAPAPLVIILNTPYFYNSIFVFLSSHIRFSNVILWLSVAVWKKWEKIFQFLFLYMLKFHFLRNGFRVMLIWFDKSSILNDDKYNSVSLDRRRLCDIHRIIPIILIVDASAVIQVLSKKQPKNPKLEVQYLA